MILILIVAFAWMFFGYVSARCLAYDRIYRGWMISGWHWIGYFAMLILGPIALFAFIDTERGAQRKAWFLSPIKDYDKENRLAALLSAISARFFIIKED